jgi:DNA-directed RNA polymerase specialized sigma24 family protein
MISDEKISEEKIIDWIDNPDKFCNEENREIEGVFYKKYYLSTNSFINKKITHFKLKIIAEDVLNEAFIRLKENILEKKKIMSLGAYYHTTCLYVFYEQSRRHKIYEKLHVTDKVDSLLFYFEDETKKNKLLDRLKIFLSKNRNNKCVQLYYLHYNKDHSLKEIANIFGISYDALRQMKKRKCFPQIKKAIEQIIKKLNLEL